MGRLNVKRSGQATGAISGDTVKMREDVVADGHAQSVFLKLIWYLSGLKCVLPELEAALLSF